MHRPCSKRRASTMHDTPGSPDSRIPAEGIRTVLISDCAVIHATHVEDAWIAGQERAAMRLEGLGL
jgi:hypothetical protein